MLKIKIDWSAPAGSVVTPSSNTHKSPNDFLILMISFTSLFEINKANPFSTPTAPFLFIFLSNLFISFEAKSLTNPEKSEAKNKAGTIFWINKKNFEYEELPHELFLTRKQAT